MPQAMTPLDNDDVREALRSLRCCLSDFIDFDPTLRPGHLMTRFGVGRDLARRVVAACSAPDDLGFAHESPGTASLRTLVSGAERGGVESALADRTGRAVERYSRIIDTHFGDHSMLKTMVASVVPRLRAPLELKRKQSAFRGARDIRGVYSELELSVSVFARCPSTGDVRIVFSGTHLGLRRLWPGQYLTRDYCRKVNPDTSTYEPNHARHIVEDWAARSGANRYTGRYSYPWIEPSMHRHGDYVDLCIERPMLGPRQAVNVGYSMIVPNIAQRDGRLARHFGSIYMPSHPTKLMIADTLVDSSLMVERDPELRIYDMSVEGPVGFDDKTRESDRIDLSDAVVPLGDGPHRHDCPECPLLQTLVDFSLPLIGPTDHPMRAYRFRQEYPVYGSQVSTVFEAAEPSEHGSA